MTRLIALAGLALGCAALPAADWPLWRGPRGDGVVTDPVVPVTWSATENVAWKVPVPGAGHSSPVVSNGRVFLTSFLLGTGDRVLLCFDRAVSDGRLFIRSAAHLWCIGRPAGSEK
jgi:outer membrane protein assembly factor BamB